MKTVKHPNWDKVKREEQQMLFTPGTPGEKVPFGLLEVGMMAEASVKGVVIKTRLSEIHSSSSANAEIFRINNNHETIDSLSVEDTVFIEIRDIKYLDAGKSDINTPLTSAIGLKEDIYE